MAPSAGRVELEVVAKVEAALAGLARVQAQVAKLAESVAASAGRRLTIDTTQAEASIKSVLDKLTAFLAEAKTKGSIVLKADAQQALSAVSSAEKSITASLDRIKTKAAQADPLTPLANQAQKAAQSINADLDKLDKSVDKTFAALKKRAAENVFAGLGESAAKEATKLNAEFKRIEAAFQAAVSKLNAEARKTDFNPASQSAQRLRENVRLAAEDVLAFANRVKTSTAQAGGDFQRLGAAVDQARVKLDQFSSQASGTLLQRLGALQEKFLSVQNAVTAFLGAMVVQKIYSFVEATAEAAVKIELLKTAFTGLLGGTTEANEQFAFLRQLADDFGVSFIELVERFRGFAPAAKEAGLSLQQTDDIFKAVVVSARALGFSTEETQRALLAFQQILQKGKFQGEELTKQLGQLLPNALGILARETGKSTFELSEMMKQGKLTKEAIFALSAGLLDAFGPTSIGNAKTAAAEIERFKNTIFDLKSAIGAELLPAVVDLLDALKSSGKDGQAAFEGIGKKLSGLIEKVTTLSNILRDVFSVNIKGFVFEIGALLVDLAALFSGAFLKSIDLVAAAFHKLGIISDETFTALKGATLEIRQAFDQVSDGYRVLAKESRGQADQFADSWTGANRRISDGIAESTKRNREKYKEFTDSASADAEKLTKKERAELEKREKGFEAFFTKISELADKSRQSVLAALEPQSVPDLVNPESGTGTGKSSKLTELGQQIKDVEKAAADLRKQLAEVEGQAIVSSDQIGKAQELRGEIGRLEAALQGLKVVKAGEDLKADIDAEAAAIEKAAKVTQESAVKIGAALTDLVTRNDDFRESFAQLEPAAQAAVTAIVGQLERVAAAGKVTNADITEFGSRLLDVFTKSGAVSATFAAKLKSELGAVEGSFGSAETALRNYAAELNTAAVESDKLAVAAGRQASAVSAAGQSVAFIDEKTGRWTIETNASTEAVHKQGGALAEVVGFFDRNRGAVLDAQTAQTLFGLSLKEVSLLLHSAGVDVAEFGGKLKVVEGSAQAAGTGVITLGGKVFEIKGKAQEAGKGLDEAGKKVEDLGKKTLDPAPAASVDKLATAGKSAADNIQATATAALQAEPALAAVAVSAEKFAAAKIDATGADAIVAIGAAAAVAKPGLDGAATAVEKIAAGLKGITSEQAEALTALGTAAATAGPQLATAAEPAGKFGAALQVIATSLGTIDTDIGDVATGLGDLSAAITTAVEAGSLSTLAGAFGDLEAKAGPLATDLVGMATALEDVVKNAQPAADGLGALQKAAGEINLKAATTAIGDLDDKAKALAGHLGDASKNAATLDTGLKASAGSADTLKTAASGLGDELSDHFKRALGVAVTGLSELKGGLDAAKKANGELRVDVAKLGTEGVTHINNTTTAVNGLVAALQSALELARQLRSEMSQISLG